MGKKKLDDEDESSAFLQASVGSYTFTELSTKKAIRRLKKIVVYGFVRPKKKNVKR